MSNFWKSLKKPFFVLAPMDDVTDTVFRQIIASAARPDVFISEFVNVDGLMSAGRDKLIRKLEFTDVERPIVAQIWGLKPENFYEVAKQVVQMGFDGVDINMGCPERDVIKAGACIALINNRSLAKEIIAATIAGVEVGSVARGPVALFPPVDARSTKFVTNADSVDRELRVDGALSKRATPRNKPAVIRKVPVSVKTRLGMRQIQTEDWIGFLLEQRLDALAVHGRTASEMSKVPAHWDEIGKVVRIRDSMEIETMIIGNGDVMDRGDGLKKADEYGVDGVMIGRGVFANLWVFDKKGSKRTRRVTQRAEESKYKKLQKAIEHVRLFEKTWGGEKNPQILKKFFKIYISGFEGASELRSELMTVRSYSEMKNILGKILD